MKIPLNCQWSMTWTTENNNSKLSSIMSFRIYFDKIAETAGVHKLLEISVYIIPLKRNKFFRIRLVPTEENNVYITFIGKE